MSNKLMILGHIGVGGQKGWLYSLNGMAPCVPATTYKDPIKFLFKGEDKMSEQTTNYRIRKLTPTECYRPMGFEDKDVNAAREVGMSNSSLYKQAGNSIITDCVELLAEQLYKAQYDDTYICRDECDKCKTPFPKDWMDENFTQPQI